MRGQNTEGAHKPPLLIPGISNHVKNSSAESDIDTKYSFLQWYHTPVLSKGSILEMI